MSNVIEFPKNQQNDINNFRIAEELMSELLSTIYEIKTDTIHNRHENDMMLIAHSIFSMIERMDGNYHPLQHFVDHHLTVEKK